MGRLGLQLPGAPILGGNWRDASVSARGAGLAQARHTSQPALTIYPGDEGRVQEAWAELPWEERCQNG